MSVMHEFTKGLWQDLPPFRLVLGLCPTLAVTNSANNGLGNQVTALEHMRRAVSMEPDNMEYLNALNRMEHGGAAYRQAAGNFRGFTMGADPCTSLCLCYLANLFCCGGRGMFCCI